MTTKSDHLFMGKNPYFCWWFGTVEDNGDPHGLGRCRVRVVGWHNTDTTQLPTDALPWAFPVESLRHSSVGGIGYSHKGPSIGTRVFGFFLDGETGQQPVMLGSLSGTSTGAPIKYIPIVTDGIGQALTANAALANNAPKDPPLPKLAKIPLNATPPQPVPNKVIAHAPQAREGACPSVTTGTAAPTNETLPDHRDLSVSTGDWVCPATGFVGSPYGPRSGSMHMGVDICSVGFFQQTDPGAAHCKGAALGPVGNPVYAAAAGKVIHIFRKDQAPGEQYSNYDADGDLHHRGYGNAIVLHHNIKGVNYLTIYAHLGSQQDADNSTPNEGVLVKVDDVVSQGQQIGTMGRTHNRDTLTHLHFEVRCGGIDGSPCHLPKSANHIPPGVILKQLANRHTAYMPNKMARWNDPPKYKPSDAPVQAKAGSNPPVNQTGISV